MPQQLQVDIVTPQRQYFSGSAKEVVVPGWEGQMDILPDHDLFLVLLRGGVAAVRSPEGDRQFVIGRGFVECAPDHVTVLTDHCEEADQIDASDAQQALAEIEEQMGQGTWPETAAADEELEIVRARASL